MAHLPLSHVPSRFANERTASTFLVTYVLSAKENALPFDLFLRYSPPLPRHTRRICRRYSEMVTLMTFLPTPAKNPEDPEF